MATRHGTFVWYELTAADPDASTAFYRAVMNWSEQDAGLPGFRYTVLSIGDVPVAGIMAATPERAAGWTGYVGVRDVDAAAARAVELGGTLQEAPADVPGIGRYAILADPQGASMALFKGDEGDAPVLPADMPGSGGWHELHTTDWAAAWPFYEAMFGWTLRGADDLGLAEQYQVFSTGTDEGGAMMTDRKGRPRWLYYFTVDGMDDAMARVRMAGGLVIAGPHQVPDGPYIVHCVDAVGTPFALGSKSRSASG